MYHNTWKHQGLLLTQISSIFKASTIKKCVHLQNCTQRNYRESMKSHKFNVFSVDGVSVNRGRMEMVFVYISNSLRFISLWTRFRSEKLFKYHCSVLTSFLVTFKMSLGFEYYELFTIAEGIVGMKFCMLLKNECATTWYIIGLPCKMQWLQFSDFVTRAQEISFFIVLTI